MTELFHSYLLQHAATASDDPAVAGVAGQWAYGELARRAEQYAAELDASGLRHGDVVVLECHPQPEAIALLIAAASLGVVFVNVSPDTPAERKQDIIEHVEATAHVVEASNPASAAQVPVRGYLTKEAQLHLYGGVTDPGPRRVPVPADLVYVIFTSGSTGTPKGIMMSHRAVVALWRGLASMGVRSGVRLGTTAPLQFDFSILDLGMALGHGGCLVQVPRILAQQPKGLVRFLAKHRVTQLNGVPSLWRELLRSESAALLAEAELDTVVYGGEAFPVDGVSALRAALPGLRIVNAFGHSESIACAFKEVPEPIEHLDGRIPFGAAAFPGMRMTVVDADGRIVREPGVTGELYVSGDCLFDGYFKDPDATSRALVPDPAGPGPAFRSGDLVFRDEQGEHYFVGRKDNQVKLGGNRVELDEVDLHLRRHPLVAEAASVVSGGEDQAHIVSFVRLLPDAGQPDDVLSELRGRCVHALPRYMVPARLEVVAEIPTTANGKVDRAALEQGLQPA